MQFKTVLDDMRKQDAIGEVPAIERRPAQGERLSIAQCEYWSDTFDRWAEDLVEPSMGGT